jgi:predicted HTH transcriptional regulator
MARRKYRSTQPVTERSFLEYLSTPALQTSRIELLRLVRGGEDTYLELKVKLSNPEKIAQGICALANTGGGVMVFGVSDQLRVEGVDDPEDVRDEIVRICREQISPQLVPYIDLIAFDNGRRVVAVEIEGKRRPYQTRVDGRYFIRIGADKREATREELSVLLDEARPLRYENIIVPGASDADIDEAHLWSFVREFAGDAFDSDPNARDYPTADVLKRDLLLAAGNMGEAVPTVAGLLLFGRDERVAALLPRSTVTAIRYAGDTVQDAEVERVELKGNLHTLYESALRFIARYCDLLDARPRPRQTAASGDVPEDAPVAARANYQRAAVGEAVANALVHRDLALRDHTTRLLVFDHSIEILNPRRTAGFAPPAQRAIRYGVPQQLNPQLAAIFRSPAYGLALPHGGLPMLLRQARLFSTRRADINLFNDEFRLRLYGI